tara:strand:- start:2141 stop:2839 length:699 start_codon:yes stop_codon:yes gene_type:complete
VVDQIREAGGEVFGITSEPQALAVEAEEAWNLNFPIVGDPHHEIRKVCAERGWLDLFYNENAGHLRNRKWTSHPKGYYQPGVLAIHKTGRVLYRWRCVPKYSNMAGAGSRPEAIYTLEEIKNNFESAEDAPMDKNPKLPYEPQSWPRFLLGMTAHGWFLRPKVFPLMREGDTPSANPEKMMRRVWGFLAMWAVLLAFLPTSWVGIAAAVWVAALTPGIIEIHKQFQNETEDF